LSLAYDVEKRYTNVISKYTTPTDQLAEIDRSKNRSEDNLPTRSGLLTTIPYINASLIEYNNMRYIATQHPMENTIIDFWKMILLEQPSLILMLNGYEYKREQLREVCDILKNFSDIRDRTEHIHSIGPTPSKASNF
jgi:protein tyrosine phosphatase